ncbi:MAG: hypothetical protein NWF04_00965 [Candidatus Bathyarchaeota archaeon]|nr:hypothetical protein [Candidatus Bathyarchaeota archaeon]
MGFLKNALQRVRSSAPKMDFYKHKHGECENFDNGRCKAAGFTNLDANGTACPHFKPKQQQTADKKTST